MRKNKVTQRDILFVSVSMFAIVALWIGFNLYHSWVASTISEDLQIQIIPIAPKFDTQTLNDLKSRKKIKSAGSVVQTTVSVTPTATPVASETEISPTPQLEADQPLAETEEPTPTL